MADSVKPAVVVPFYKSSLNSYEKTSLYTLFTTLSRHQIFFVVPASLYFKVSAISHNLANYFGVSSPSVISVDDFWLSSVSAYNLLLLQPFFYRLFASFTHLLVFQFDCLVFRDELTYWCQTEFHYIGAPLYWHGSLYGESNIRCCGVGGFSLRNVSAFVTALEHNPFLLSVLPASIERLSAYNYIGKIAFSTRLLRFLFSSDFRLRQRFNSIHHFLGINEDEVYGLHLPSALRWFRVADYESSASFAFDRYVINEYSRTSRLPFGAHAWFKSDNLHQWQCVNPQLSSWLLNSKDMPL